MAKYVWEQKYMRPGMKNRKSPNRGLKGWIKNFERGFLVSVNSSLAVG